MRRWAWAVLSLVTLPLAAIPAPLRAAPPVLTVMVEDASEPFSRRDGTGYANDVVKAAFRAAGIEVRLDVVPYARCKKSLEDGVTPACFAMSWLPQFQGRIRFSDRPLFEVDADVFQNVHAKTISRAADLGRGATVGIINGYEYPGEIFDLARRGVVLERNTSEAANLAMLARGRLDAAVMMTSEIENMPRRLAILKLSQSVRLAFRSGRLKSYIGFSLINSQGESARRAFNRGYAIILADHTRDRIRAVWMKNAFTLKDGRP